ncbi:MAG TPA: energy transducer TonB [Candidatus Angelobacter sp.]|nr:energy transducer TonB [Candidatus Angelobacter sp.]
MFPENLFRRLGPALATLSLTLCLHAQSQLTAQDLINSSNTASDLAKLGSYRLKATITADVKPRPIGTLIFDNDGHNSREELAFSDYHEIRLGRGDSISVWRRPDVDLAVSDWVAKLNGSWQLRLPATIQPGPVERDKIHGIQALCFKTTPEKGTEIRNCFDAATHLLISHEERTGEFRKEARFLDYREIGEIRFPSSIRFLQSGLPELDAQEIAVSTMPFDAARFAPLPGVRVFRTCRDPRPPKLTHRVEPEYPLQAKLDHISGDVRMLVTIGEDGNVHNLHAVTGNPFLAQAAVTAVKQWRYTPEMCPSGPVAMETTIKVSFRMGLASTMEPMR